MIGRGLCRMLSAVYLFEPNWPWRRPSARWVSALVGIGDWLRNFWWRREVARRLRLVIGPAPMARARRDLPRPVPVYPELPEDEGEL